MLTNLYKKRYPGLLGPSINKLTAGQLLGGERVYRNPRNSPAARARISINSLAPSELSSCFVYRSRVQINQDIFIEGGGTVQGLAVLVQYVKNMKIMRGET